jgi:hypothetical protein
MADDTWETTKAAIHKSVADHLSSLDYVLGGPQNAEKWKPREGASDEYKRATTGMGESQAVNDLGLGKK